MQKLFNKILVPVDFTSRSQKAVEKAAEIACQYNCSVHLLHVLYVSPLTALAYSENHQGMPEITIENKAAIKFQLEQLCEAGRKITKDTVMFNYSIRIGFWDDAVIEFVHQHAMDLVLVGQRNTMIEKRKMFLNPDKIATQTNAPVITVPSNRRIIRLYNIVIPITDFLPVRKLMYGVYIASYYETTIKLLGIENEKTNGKVRHYIDKAHRLIRDNCNVKVELEMYKSGNVAEAVNRYAHDKAADLVILNPGTQTKMPGLLASLFGNIVQKYSVPPVLTVKPV